MKFKNESELFPKICKDHPDNFLIFATRSGIALISLDTPERWDVTLPLTFQEVQNTIAVDFHWDQKLIFYSDIHLDVIRFEIKLCPHNLLLYVINHSAWCQMLFCKKLIQYINFINFIANPNHLTHDLGTDNVSQVNQHV